MEKDNITYEVCPHCGREVELTAELKVQKCPHCGRYIVACSMCINGEVGYPCSCDCPLIILARKMNEDAPIMNTTNGHNRGLVDAINTIYRTGAHDMLGMIMKSLYFRDLEEMKVAGIITDEEFDGWWSLDWDWEKYAYDYLMHVADDADLRTIINYMRYTDGTEVSVLYM